MCLKRENTAVKHEGALSQSSCLSCSRAERSEGAGLHRPAAQLASAEMSGDEAMSLGYRSCPDSGAYFAQSSELRFPVQTEPIISHHSPLIAKIQSPCQTCTVPKRSRRRQNSCLCHELTSKDNYESGAFLSTWFSCVKGTLEKHLFLHAIKDFSTLWKRPEFQSSQKHAKLHCVNIAKRL